MAELNEAERDLFYEEKVRFAKAKRPEVARKAEEHTDMLMKIIFGGGHQ